MPQKIAVPARLYRAGVIEPFERAEPEDGDDRRVRLSFSSEAPVERYFGFEILGHRPGEVDLSRLDAGVLPLLVDHRAEIDSQVGVVESVTIADGRGTAIARFGKGARAMEILDRVRDGEIVGVSVGYSIEAAERDGTRDGTPVIRATRWTPLEISFVPIPADKSVGVGRAAEGAGTRELTLTTRDTDMPTENTPAAEVEPKNVPATPKAQDPADQLRAERARAREIRAMGQRFKIADAEVEAAIDAGTSVEAFGRKVLDHLGSADATALRSEAAKIGLSEREVRRYSIVNALRYLSDPNDARARKAAGFEIEVSEAAAARSGAAPKGLLVPADILARDDFHADRGARAADLIAGDAAQGGATVATNLLTGSFIEMLRKRTSIMRAGVTVLGGLVGNIAIPKQTGGATSYWVGEDTAPANSGATFGQAPMTPHTVGAFTEISRRLLIQSSLDVEALVRRDLSTCLALAIDGVGLNGSAEADAPDGLADVAGINSVTFATAGKPTFAEMVALETEVAADDADVGAMSYIFNARMRGHLKTTPKVEGHPTFIMEGGQVNGYGTITSNQAATGEAWFGNWADLIVGLWSGLDLTVDPYSASTTGAVRVIAFQDVDFAVRNAASFALGRGA